MTTVKARNIQVGPAIKERKHASGPPLSLCIGVFQSRGPPQKKYRIIACFASVPARVVGLPNSAIQHALDGAKGAVLVYEGNYDQAVPVLERDNENAFSVFRLAYAGQKTASGQLTQVRLNTARAFKEPTPEQAFVAPAVELASASKAEHPTAVQP